MTPFILAVRRASASVEARHRSAAAIREAAVNRPGNLLLEALRRMVRDLMLACVEQRFNALRAPHPVRRLADNGSAYVAGEALEFSAALALVPCFTPVRSPESIGISEAFVKALKPGSEIMLASNLVRVPSRFCNSFKVALMTTTRINRTVACVCAHVVSSFKPISTRPVSGLAGQIWGALFLQQIQPLQLA
jgi:transposase InsO family protein